MGAVPALGRDSPHILFLINNKILILTNNRQGFIIHFKYGDFNEVKIANLKAAF